MTAYRMHSSERTGLPAPTLQGTSVPTVVSGGAEAVADATQHVAHVTPSVKEIVFRHGRYVWRLLRYLGVADRDVDDVCQEVFTTVYRKHGALTDDGLRPWLNAICINHAKNYRRRAAHHRETLFEDVPESVVAPPQEERLELADAQKHLLGLLDRLDEDKRTIFVLRAIEDLPMEQVAKIVGCPTSTAYFKFRRACDELESSMETP